MNSIQKINKPLTKASLNEQTLESKLRIRLSSLLLLSNQFIQANCIDEIVDLLLSAAVSHTEALGVSFLPTDDRIAARFKTNLDQDLSSSDFNQWIEYLGASSIRSQCRICRKEHPVSEVCPLLSNPFPEKVKIFCIHLRKSNQKLGVINLFFKRKIDIEPETQDYLQAIGNTAALAISSLSLGGYNLPNLDILQTEEPHSPPKLFTNVEIQREAILEERSRLAREIHDGLAQILGYVKLQLSQSIDLLKSGETYNLTNLVSSSYQAISDAYIDAREAIDDLHTLKLAADFSNWLRRTLQEFGESFNIETEIIGLPPDLIYSTNQQLHITRMVQEILSNIRKHAGAKNIKVIYLETEQNTALEIQDDGVGFNVQEVVHRSQHGLRSLQERADIIGAELEIEGHHGKGTIVRIQIPKTNFRNTT